MISKAAQRVLQMMVKAYDEGELMDAELVRDGSEVWVGYHRTTSRIVDELLRHALVRDDSDVKGAERYVVTEDSRKAAIDRDYMNPALRAALAVNTRQRTASTKAAVEPPAAPTEANQIAGMLYASMSAVHGPIVVDVMRRAARYLERLTPTKLPVLTEAPPMPKYYCTWDGCKGLHPSKYETCAPSEIVGSQK